MGTIMTATSPIYEQLRADFDKGVTRPAEWRMMQLRAMLRLGEDNAESMIAALHKDMHKPAFESRNFELASIKLKCHFYMKNLKKLMKERSVDRVDNFTMGCPTSVLPIPYGVVFVVGTWNFPLVFFTGGPVGGKAICKLAVEKMTPTV